MIRPSLLLLPLLLACQPKTVEFDTGAIDQPDTAIGSDDPVDTGETGEPVEEEPTYEEYDDATLVINAPTSGEVLPLGDVSTFSASVLSSTGEDMGWTEIDWSSDLDSAWLKSGNLFNDNTLIAGTHAITAEAKLPNGDRLSTTIGGVRVQHEDAGTYYGDVNVDVTVEYDGTPYTVSCIGGILLVVDETGETVTGDSACTISLFGYDTEITNVFDLSSDVGELSGVVSVDLSWFAYDIDATGTLSDGDLEATWSDDIAGYATVTGTLSAFRVSTDTTVGE